MASSQIESEQDKSDLMEALLASSTDMPAKAPTVSIEEVRVMSREEVAQRLKEELCVIALNHNAKVGDRIVAIDKLLDRWEGKPVQHQHVHVTDAQKLKEILDLIEKRDREQGMITIDNNGLSIGSNVID
jgi:hypothetical protein